MVENPEKERDEPEEGSRRMDPDLLALSRIIRILEAMEPNSKRAALTYLRMRYGE